MDIPPTPFTTDQMKAVMRDLDLTFYSLKAQTEAESHFRESVKQSLRDPAARKSRLQTSPPIPKVSYSYQIVFQRNPDVVAEVLDRANGACECCCAPAPFNRASDGTPYLEVHHVKFLANGGEDTVENAEALCPNCHRKKHHGEQATALK